MKRNFYNYSICSNLDEVVEDEIKCAKSNMYRVIKIFFIILLSNVTCIFFLLYKEMNVLTLIFICLCLLYSVHEFNIFDEFSLRIHQKLRFYKSEHAYVDGLKCAPLINNGYIYVKKEEDVYTHPLKVCIVVEYPPIVDISSHGYYVVSFTELINDVISKTSYSGNSWMECRIKAIKVLENLGYTVFAVSNHFGDYVWMKGKNEELSKFERFALKMKLYSVKVLFLILIVLPLFYLFLIK